MHKANIQGNQEQRPRHPRLIGRSTWNNREEGLGFYAGSWWGWFVLREGTPPNKGNQGKPMKPKENKEKQGEPLQSTKEILSNQWDSFLNGGNTLPLSGNAKRLRAMVGRVLLVVDIVCWCGSDAEGTKGNGRRRWRGVGPAGRPSLFPFGGSVILKI